MGSLDQYMFSGGETGEPQVIVDGPWPENPDSSDDLDTVAESAPEVTEAPYEDADSMGLEIQQSENNNIVAEITESSVEEAAEEVAQPEEERAEEVHDARAEAEDGHADMQERDTEWDDNHD